jgi:hypothetical protein
MRQRAEVLQAYRGTIQSKGTYWKLGKFYAWKSEMGDGKCNA